MAQDITPDAALEKFAPLIGKWELRARTSDSDVDNITGWTSFEWMPGGYFIKSESEINFRGHPMYSMEIISYDAERNVYPASVYSSLGSGIFSYEWEVQGNTVTHFGLGATYTGMISEDGNTITGGWRPNEGTPPSASNNYDATMIRMK